MRLAKSNPADRFGRLLAIIVITFLASGIDQPWATSVTAALNLVLIVIAFRTTGLRTSGPVVVTAAAVALVVVVVTAFFDNGSTGAGIASFAQCALLAVLTIALLRSVLAHEDVTIQTILGAVSAYALIGMMFSYLYLGIESVDAGQFSMPASSPSAFPEFSFVVLTTLGFGNQLPTASMSSRFVVSEAVIGQIFLATFVARLVTLYPRKSPTIVEE